jgi:branched-chain amino acid transport system permease protein
VETWEDSLGSERVLSTYIMGIMSDRGSQVVRDNIGGIIVGLSGLLLLADLAGKLTGGGLTPARFGGFVWDGLVIGILIGLAGIGLSLTYSILGFANFAHGDYISWGAFSGWAVAYLLAGIDRYAAGGLLLIGGGGGPAPGDVGISITNTPASIVAGLIVAVGFTVGVSLLVDRLVYRPIREADGITLLIASIGVAFALRYLIVFFFYNGRQGVTDIGRIPTYDLAGVVITAHELTIVIVGLLLMLGVHLLLQRTKLGKAMRAMADNRDLAQVTGIPVEGVIRTTWILGGGLAGAAGYLVVLTQGTIAYNLGWLLLLLIFAAVIMGGIGSVYGAIVGGLGIGLASRLSLIWLTGDLSSFAEPVAFGLMIFVLLFRPEGIFGGVSTA